MGGFETPARKAQPLGMSRRPPRIPLFLVWLSTPAKYRTDQLGDLEEEYRQRVRTRGSMHATFWLWRQAIRSISPNFTTRWRQCRIPIKTTRPGTRTNLTELVFQNLRFGLRSLRRHPGFAAVTTITLALAIGVNTAIFSLVNLIVFADLPMEDAETVGVIETFHPTTTLDDGPMSAPDFLDLADYNQSFEQLAASTSGSWMMRAEDGVIAVDGVRITPNLLDLWKVGIVVGRGFLPHEGQPGASPVVILSHGFWSRDYASNPDVVGTTVDLNGVAHTVVGVLSPRMEFANLAEIEVWLPLYVDRTGVPRDERNLFVTGRLKPGVTWEQASGDVEAVSARLALEYPATNTGWTTRVQSAQNSLLTDSDEMVLVLLVMTVAFVLMIACANVANMLLARSTVRARELAVRTALGAGRGRIVAQLLTESFVIATVAGVVGLVMARALIAVLIWITAGRQLLFTLATLDGNVLVFTLIVSLAAPLLFGLVPAIRASGRDIGTNLTEGAARAGASRGGTTLRSGLVSLQIALALTLMITAGVAVRAVQAVASAQLGFDPSNVLTGRLALSEHTYDSDDRIRNLHTLLTEQIEGLHSVAEVGIISARPEVDEPVARIFAIEGRPIDRNEGYPTSYFVSASPEYFSVLRIPLQRGRLFEPRDAATTMKVALVNQVVADRYWPNDSPIGQRISVGADSTVEWTTIVGVVSNLWNEFIGPRTSLVYLPFSQAPTRTAGIMIRSNEDPVSLASQVRATVRQLDANQIIDDVRTMEQVHFDERSTDYALLTLFMAFAVFALAMAGTGIYGVTSYVVTQRSREISIRLALGATAINVRRMILTQAGRLLLIGGAAGSIGAYLMTTIIANTNVGARAWDPVVFFSVPPVLLIVALLANYIPARRATKAEPMRALRVE